MRVDNWAGVLFAEIDKASREPFVWGKNDCCLWPANVVLSLTGVDYAKKFRGKYKTAKGAYSALKRIGETTIQDTLTAKMGEVQNIRMTKRGDVVMAIIDKRETLGICIGVDVAFKTLEGITTIPLLNCSCSWSVK